MADDKKCREYVYRCRLCGDLHVGAVGSFTKLDAMDVFMELESGKEACFRLGAVIGKHSYHHCRDGGFGISHLIGVRDHL
jgi:hypothetical protein